MTSEKSKTNKKWTSTEASRANYDRIFGKKTCDNCDETKEACRCSEVEYCHGCSEVSGGADRPIYHLPPICRSSRDKT